MKRKRKEPVTHPQRSTGYVIRRVCESRNLATEELQRRTGLSLKRVREIIMHGRTPTVTELHILAYGLDVRPQDLLSD